MNYKVKVMEAGILQYTGTMIKIEENAETGTYCLIVNPQGEMQWEEMDGVIVILEKEKANV